VANSKLVRAASAPKRPPAIREVGDSGNVYDVTKDFMSTTQKQKHPGPSNVSKLVRKPTK
jgi:hypothetical protein